MFKLCHNGLFLKAFGGSVRALRSVSQNSLSKLKSRHRSYCSNNTKTEAPQASESSEVLFSSPPLSINAYRLIGASVYSQVLASCFYLEQVFLEKKESKYSRSVQLAFASGLVAMSCTVPMVFFFAVRRNIFKVTLLRDQRQLALEHLGKSLQMVETRVSLNDIHPLARLGRNLRLLINNPTTNFLDTVYLNRAGKYHNRELMEEIVKGKLSEKPQNVVESESSEIPKPAPSKYTIARKKLLDAKTAEKSKEADQ